MSSCISGNKVLTMTDPALNTFLAAHVDKAALNVHLAKATHCLDAADADKCAEQLASACADVVYENLIAKAGKDFITGDDAFPPIRTAANPYGTDVGERTLANRRQAVRGVHAALNTDVPLFIDGGYLHWLADTAAVLEATRAAYGTKGSFRLAAQSVCQLCEALGERDLKQAYWKLAAMPCPIIPKKLQHLRSRR